MRNDCSIHRGVAQLPCINPRRIIRPLVPIGLLDLGYRLYEKRQEQVRRARFEKLRSIVASTVDAIQGLKPQRCSDIAFLENELIPALGLNDGNLREQPAELARYLGNGLHIWQYPNQLARCLAWLSTNAKGIKCYMEIGCHWGGMFILITEWLRKNGANLQNAIAVDPIEPTPFIDEYFKVLKNATTIQATYVQDYSSSQRVKDLVARLAPDFVFIDGDHALKTALADHMLVRDCARIIVHHDICSHTCPDPAFLWSVLRKLEQEEFEFSEFVNQYESVTGSFLGIGTMKRRERY